MENTLLAKAVSRDKSAFEKLMLNYLKIIYNYVVFRVPVSEDVKDIIQDTMLSAWQNIASYSAKSTFKTWILGIANHKINDFLRKYYRLCAVDIDDYEDQTAEDDSADRMIVKTDVKNALETLTRREKEIVFLIFNAQLTYPEISEITGIPIGTVKSKMSAIKSKLKKELGEGYNG